MCVIKKIGRGVITEQQQHHSSNITINTKNGPTVVEISQILQNSGNSMDPTLYVFPQYN